MTQYSNQFALTTEQGQLDLQASQNVLTCQVSSSESTSIVAGQPVKLEDSAGGLPKVLALTGATSKTFGFVVRNLKDATREANETLEVAIAGSIMYMTAGAAIARGAKLEVVYTTNKVITSAGTNPVVGYALDKAAADGDIIRVIIGTPNTSF